MDARCAGAKVRLNREPIVLVPGLDGTGALYYRQVPLLERRYRVLTHRLRDDRRLLSQLVEDLDARVREAADGRRVTLVGESFGGALALSYALAHRERVGRLVILNSFPRVASRARLWLGYHAVRAMPWGLMRVARQASESRMHSPATETAERRRFHELMRATTRDGYLSRLRMLRDYDVRDRLGELRVPVLYLAADGDHLVPSVAQARIMSRLTPNATMRILEGHGHICLIAPNLNLSDILDAW